MFRHAKLTALKVRIGVGLAMVPFLALSVMGVSTDWHQQRGRFRLEAMTLATWSCPTAAPHDPALQAGSQQELGRGGWAAPTAVAALSPVRNAAPERVVAPAMGLIAQRVDCAWPHGCGPPRI